MASESNQATLESAEKTRRLDELRTRAFIKRYELEEKPRFVADDRWVIDSSGVDRRVRIHPPRWRAREQPMWQDKDIAGDTLELGEFADVQTLTISEAALVLNAIWDNRKKHGIKENNMRGNAQ